MTLNFNRTRAPYDEYDYQRAPESFNLDNQKDNYLDLPEPLPRHNQNIPNKKYTFTESFPKSILTNEYSKQQLSRKPNGLPPVQTIQYFSIENPVFKIFRNDEEWLLDELLTDRSLSHVKKDDTVFQSISELPALKNDILRHDKNTKPDPILKQTETKKWPDNKVITMEKATSTFKTPDPILKQTETKKSPDKKVITIEKATSTLKIPELNEFYNSLSTLNATSKSPRFQNNEEKHQNPVQMLPILKPNIEKKKNTYKTYSELDNDLVGNNNNVLSNPVSIPIQTKKEINPQNEPRTNNPRTEVRKEDKPEIYLVNPNKDRPISKTIKNGQEKPQNNLDNPNIKKEPKIEVDKNTKPATPLNTHSSNGNLQLLPALVNHKNKGLEKYYEINLNY